MSSVVTGWRIEAFACLVAGKHALMMAEHGMAMTRGQTVRGMCATWGVSARTWSELSVALAEKLAEIERGEVVMIPNGCWLEERLLDRGWFISHDGTLNNPVRSS